MALMYEVNTLNAAMIQAAETCRQDLPEGEKVNKVLACFAGMKPVEALPIVHAYWDVRHGEIVCAGKYGCYEPMRWLGYIKDGYFGGKQPDFCPHCGARMDGRPGQDD